MATRFFLLLLILPFMGLHAHVIQTDSLELLEAKIPDLGEHDLVLFDYDKTLMLVQDALLQSGGKKCLHVRIRKADPTLTHAQVEELISIVMLQREVAPVDPQALNVVQKLQEKQVKVFILTALRTGSYGRIPRTEEWRLSELTQHGFDFSSAFPI